MPTKKRQRPGSSYCGGAMNCCDYQCNQGRDCPARKPDFIAIAKAENEQEPDYFLDGIDCALAGFCVGLLVCAIAFAVMRFMGVL